MGIIEKENDKKIYTIDTDVTAPLQAFFNKTTVSSFEDLAEIVDIANRRIYLGDVDEATGDAVDSVIRFYNYVDEKYEVPTEDRIPIKMFIDSNGGDLLSCFTIIDSIKLSKTPVWTINQGKAYSAGMFAYVCGHKKLSFPSASFLFHEGSIMAGGDAHKFQNQADFYKKQRALMKEIIMNNTNISEELYNEHAKDDWWLTAAEAKELGIVDEILTKETYSTL